jgi:hypothetical protein
MSDNPSDTAPKVGYKHPPVHSRFKPGVSGYPQGRKKGVRNLATEVKRSLESQVTVNENGRERRVPTLEAMVRRLREKALKGDTRALDKYLAYAQAFGPQDDNRSEHRDLAEEDREILEAFVASRRDPTTAINPPNSNSDDVEGENG